MVPGSKQPNDFDFFSDANQGPEESEMEWYLSAEAEDDTFLLADQMGAADSGGDQLVTEGGQLSPADFSAEELALARDLQSLFPLEEEQLPPRFVQTLTTQPGDWIAPSNLTHRVTYRVLRRLQLPRRLFAGDEPVLTRRPRGFLPLGRAPRTAALGTLLAVMLLSLITVAPSFAQGLRIFLGQTGVQVAPRYPHPTLSPQEQVQEISLLSVHQNVPFDVFWLGPTLNGYGFQSMVLHIGQPWANGPVVELQYSRPNSIGRGSLLVREFRPAPGATVLQVVAQGAAHPAHVSGQPALYIDGQWMYRQKAIVWRYGTQAELLYQANGLIFWITADQRDGVDQAALENWAQQLGQLYLGQLLRMQPDSSQQSSALVAAALNSDSLGEVVALIPAGIAPDTGAAVYLALGHPPEDL
jgi:hypothetical protein